MAGGRRIDDHSSWMGGASKGSVFPEGAKVKEMKVKYGMKNVSLLVKIYENVCLSDKIEIVMPID